MTAKKTTARKTAAKPATVEVVSADGGIKGVVQGGRMYTLTVIPVRMPRADAEAIVARGKGRIV